MSTAKRRSRHSLHLDLPEGFPEELPPVAALFLILFDNKVGYKIAWKQSVPELELAESVEYKSLPSGLHNVEEDLIYFIHDDQYAGISAFVNETALDSERNALMLAVGALVPLSYGRLGKSWKHAPGLKSLAEKLIHDSSNTQLLDDFWTTYKSQDNKSPEESFPDSPSIDKVKRKEDKAVNGYPRKRNRAISTASALVPPGQSLSPHHPALSLPSFLNTFGPLVFPLYKAALLRKRILLMGTAPVELSCNFVYDISILSGIPSSVSDLIPLEPLPSRLQPLFAIGIHDVHTLAQGSRDATKPKNSSDDDMGFGWVACTTDNILAIKEDLFDALITIPPLYSKQAREKVWPKIELKRGTEVKATQRDLRRYQTLRRGLRHCSARGRAQSPLESFSSANRIESQEPLSIENAQETFDDASSTCDENLIEPQSWSALAYSSFMWWASAGEKRTDLEEEAEHDAALLGSLRDQRDDSPNRPRSSRISPGMPFTGDSSTDLEMAIVAYFHRLTALILGTLAEIIEASDNYDDEQSGKGQGRNTIFVTSEEMARMGLDIWSEGDRKFVKELVDFYWGRKAEVQRARVECCGVRIC